MAELLRNDAEDPIPQRVKLDANYTPPDGDTDTFEPATAEVPDGADQARGATDDAKETDPDATATEMALIKGQLQKLIEVASSLDSALDADGDAFDTNADFSASTIVAEGKDANDNQIALPIEDINGTKALRVFDRLAIQADDNDIQAVPDTDRVVAGGSLVTVQTYSGKETGSNTVISAPSSGSIRLLSWELTSSTAQEVTLQDGQNGGYVDGVFAEANSGIVKEASQGHLAQLSAATGLYLNLGGGNAVHFRCTYVVA